MDEPVFEPYFEMGEFQYFSHQSGEWKEIKPHLDQIDETSWARLKAHNQTTYDRYMLPEKVANYVVGELEKEISK
jgi:hypothetical protein